MAANITVLQTLKGRKATKVFRIDADGVLEVDSYDRAKYFTADIQLVGEISELSTLLAKLESEDDKLIIRGTPIRAVDLSQKLRRKKYQPGAGTPNDYPFIDEPRLWMMIDIDSLVCPKTIDPVVDPISAIKHAISELPEEFHDVSCHWQFSSSMGMNGGGHIKVHLWYWLTDPKTSDELRNWAKSVNADKGWKLIDPALFNVVQPHYTSAPLFEGMSDPLPTRYGLLSKKQHSVSLVLSKPTAATKPKVSTKGLAVTTGGVLNILEALGDQAGADGFHNPLLRATSSFVATLGKAEAEKQRDAFKELLKDCIADADQSNHTAEQIDRYSSDVYLDGLIDSGIAKYGSGKREAFPHFNTMPLSVSDAEEALYEAVVEFTEKAHSYSLALAKEDEFDPSTFVTTPIPTVGIRAAAGLGKTLHAVNGAIGSKPFLENVFFYFVPSLKLAEQVQKDLTKDLGPGYEFKVIRCHGSF